MSYLMALYVYYHGNNLSMFGIIKGEDPDLPKNAGLKHPEEINPDLVDSKLIQEAQEVQRKEAVAEQTTDWDKMMKAAILASQKESFNLYSSGAMNNTIFESTPETVIDDYEDDYQIPMSFFDEINPGMNNPNLNIF